MDKSTHKLLNVSMIYFVGNALTQLLSLLLLKFVTGNITPEEYGIYDLVISISNLVVPVVTLQIADALFRFVIRARDDSEKKSYFTIAFIISAASIFITCGGVLFAGTFVIEIPNLLLIMIYMVVSNLYGMYHKIARCLQRNKVYVIGNLIKTALYLLLEIVLISWLDMGVEALFIAAIISTVAFLIFAEVQVKSLKYFSLKSASGEIAKEMLKFSVPLIPNAAFWWMTSSVNAIIVSARLGTDINGIYSVSNKFSAIITMVTGVFNMAWQESAISEYGGDDFGRFFTKTFNSFFKLVFSAIAVIIPFVAVIFPYIIDSDYNDAVQYTPYLLLAAGISAFSGFLAQIFSGQGKTERALYTSMLGMITNTLFVFLFVDRIGLWAAVFGTLLSDVAILVFRFILVRNDFGRGVEFVKLSITIAVLAASILLYSNFNSTLNIIWFAITVIFALILNKEFIKEIFHVIFKRKIKDNATLQK